MIAVLAAALAAAAPRATPHPGLQAAVDAIVPEVAASRALPLLRPVRVVVEDEEDVRARTRREYRSPAGRRELARTQGALEALRLAPPGLDLATLAIDAFGESLGAWYDPLHQRLVLVRRPDAFADEGFSLDSQDGLVALHELVHALQHQHADLLRVARPKGPSGDVRLAALCTVEGDATYAMVRLAAGDDAPVVDAMSPEDFADSFLGAPSEAPPPDTALARLPLVVREGLLAPYDHGLRFAQALVASGGTARLDAALLAPPLSTEHVLHPAAWLADPDPVRWPELPPLRSLLGPGWRLVDDDVLGELGMRAALASWLNVEPTAPEIVEAAAGWGGDRYLAARHRDGRVLGLVWTAWDTDADADAFATLVRGAPEVHVTAGADRVILVLGAPETTRDAISDALVRAPEQRWRSQDDARRALSSRTRGAP